MGRAKIVIIIPPIFTLMNRNIFIIVGVVIILAGGALYAGFKMTAERKQKAEAGALMNGQMNETISGTWTDLLSQKKPMTCTFAFEDSENSIQTSGRVYVADGAMRGDFETRSPVANPPVTKTHMIKVDNISYIWGMDGKNGYRMTVTDDDIDQLQSYLPKAAQSTESAAQPTDQQDASYDCRAWSVEPTMFEPPSNIVFVDMSLMMDQIPTRLENDSPVATDACEACQMAPDEATRASCKKAIGCP